MYLYSDNNYFRVCKYCRCEFEGIIRAQWRSVFDRTSFREGGVKSPRHWLV